jgi:hypothetical protein
MAQVKARLITCARPEEFIELMNQYEAEAGEWARYAPPEPEQELASEYAACAV